MGFGMPSIVTPWGETLGASLAGVGRGGAAFFSVFTLSQSLVDFGVSTAAVTGAGAPAAGGGGVTSAFFEEPPVMPLISIVHPSAKTKGQSRSLRIDPPGKQPAAIIRQIEDKAPPLVSGALPSREKPPRK